MYDSEKGGQLKIPQLNMASLYLRVVSMAMDVNAS